MKEWVQQNCTDCQIDCILWQKEALLYPTRHRTIQTIFEECPKEKHKLLQVVVSLSEDDDIEYMQRTYGNTS